MPGSYLSGIFVAATSESKKTMAKGNPHPAVRWEKGQSGNPTGRARMRLTVAIRKYFETDENVMEFIKVGLDAARAGDFQYWKYIFDRADGRMIDEEVSTDVIRRIGDALQRELDRRAGLERAGENAGEEPG